MNDKKIIMVGPDLEGWGGISRVANIWQSCGFFSDHSVKYVPSVTYTSVNRIVFLIRNLLKFSISLLCGYDLVYIHTALYRSLYRKSLFILIALFFRKKVILHIHPSMFCQFLSKLKGFERGYILFLLRRVYAFVILTEEMKSNIHFVFPDKRVFILPNPINLQQMINEEGIERAENDLLYLGWYVREKGVYELVDAMQILVHNGVNIHLNFYGTKELENLKSYVKKKNLTEKITVNGWITGKKKLKVLYESTALILPSHTEGIPNVILEAMATKTPIIATLVGGLKEILKDGKNAIIAEAGNPRDLSEKILKCLQDKELRDRIVANAYQDSGTKYDVHIIKEKFGQIIKTVTV